MLRLSVSTSGMMLVRCSTTARSSLSSIRCSTGLALSSTRLARLYSSSTCTNTSNTWIQQYTQLDFTQRQGILRDEVLPQLFPSTADSDDSLLPANVSALYHELSRKKGAIKTSMLLRDDITVLLKNKDDKEERKKLKFVDKTLQHFLQQSLCCYDSMTLQRITFEESSGLILENVARGESVHRVRSIRELKRRLHDGKRCFALFHPAMKEDPLVFIHVALTTTLAGTLR